MNTPSPRSSRDAIDALITWVDGASSHHRKLRNRYMDQARSPLSENGTNPHRWEEHNEIYYCLNSIGCYAPWMRKIWIVTDGQRPDLSAIDPKVRAKIHFVDHRDIFQGQQHCIPTFNSVSIETVMWTIPDLAEQFLYFNDDVFLTNDIAPEDFFNKGQPRLRGRWEDLTSLSASKTQQNAPEIFNFVMHLNAALILGLPINKVFKSAHVVHPFLKSHMQELAETYPIEFAANALPKFRDTTQFSPQAIHNQSLLMRGKARIIPVVDHMHVYSGIDTKGLSALGISQSSSKDQTIKMICINDLPKVIEIYPDILNFLDTLVPVNAS